jgi:prevent-host-death family protein
MPIATVPLDSKNFTNVRQHFSEIVNQVARQERRVLVEKHGAPVAAIISPEDLKRLDRLEDEERRRLAAFRAISERFTDVPLDVLEREVAKSIALAGRSNPSRS